MAGALRITSLRGASSGRAAALVPLAAWAVIPVFAGIPPARAATVTCVHTPDATTGMPWAQRWLRPERVWHLTTGAGVTVAVIDGGVDAAQPQLAGQVVRGPDVLGPPGGPSTSDCSGHGTLVAGIIAARPMAGTPFHGVAPGARLLSIRQTEQDPGMAQPRGDTNGMARAIEDAVDLGAKVINISATTPDDVPALREAVGYAIGHDVLIVAAAGNGSQGGSPGTAPRAYYPAAYPGVLAVAATGPDGRRIASSHEGSYVGVAAPGEDIVSTGPNGPGRYAVVSGTSFATAFASGVAALVRAYLPALSARQVIARIERTADRPPPAAGHTDAAQVGAGIVDLLAAVTGTVPKAGAGQAARAGRPSHGTLWPRRLTPVVATGISIAAAVAIVLAGFLFSRAAARGGPVTAGSSYRDAQSKERSYR